MIISHAFNYKKSKISPLLLTFPHSGRNYRSTLKKLSHLNLNDLRKSEDSYLDLLLEKNYLNFNYIIANFPRIFVDVNRSPLEIDHTMWKGNFNSSRFFRSFRVNSGIGVIPKVSFEGINIYNELLLFKEARKRLLRYYFPYHRRIKSFIVEIKKKHNKIIILDCHSMSSEIVDDDVDIVLSNCDGKSSNLAIINSIKNYFNKCGYKVNFNMPFKGGFITRYYGKPEVNVHVIQIEINKKLYLDEKNFNIKDKEFSDLKNCFSEIINYINFNISSI